MNQYANPYLNPYGLQPQGYQPYPVGPQMQVTKVNGEPGARSFQMGANSSALLLDESGLMVWLVTSDAIYSAGTPERTLVLSQVVGRLSNHFNSGSP